MAQEVSANIDPSTVEGFGEEWTRFQQGSDAQAAELDAVFESYFAIFPWDRLPAAPVGFDMGCGSGRWARRAARRVGHLHCIDASPQALEVARTNLADVENVSFVCASVDAVPLEEASMDFGFSLGVLHHVPDTAAGIASCARLLKKGAPMLLYLYYAFDDKPAWFRGLWRASNVVRRGIARLPHRPRHAVCDGVAASVYWPLARTARVAERLGRDVSNFPLAAYRDKSFYTMRTDALDRFGTQLEQRFTRVQIREMMEAAGLEDVRFSDFPHWCAVGFRR